MRSDRRYWLYWYSRSADLGGAVVWMWRAGAAGLSVIVAAAAGVVTSLVTAHPSAGLWVAVGALAVVGAALQAWVTAGERRARRDGAAESATQPAGSVPGGVVNVISGGVQQGPVLQGRDFAGLSFGVPSDRPQDMSPGEDGS